MLDFGDTPAQQVTAIVVIINRAIPLFLAGLAVAVAFRMGLFNIGVEGQYRLATIMAAAVGAAVVAARARCTSLLIVVVAMVVGALWAGIVAVLKVTRGVSEVISSIMLNFIALGLASYLLTGPFRGSAEGASIVSTAEIPESGLARRAQRRLRRARPGQPAAAALRLPADRDRRRRPHRGAAQPHPLRLRPARPAGSRRRRRAPAASTPAAWSSRRCCCPGAIAGLIGLPDLLGTTHAYTTNFTAGLGFLGIAVALLGRNRPGRHRVRRAAVRLPRPGAGAAADRRLPGVGRHDHPGHDRARRRHRQRDRPADRPPARRTGAASGRHRAGDGGGSPPTPTARPSRGIDERQGAQA